MHDKQPDLPLKPKRKTKDERLKALGEREAAIKARLAEIRRRRSRIESDAKRASRRRITRAKIICGGLVMSYLRDHPQDRWCREYMREELRKNPAIKLIPELLEFYRLIDRPDASRQDGV
jgi:regulator of protease activity HflC (stomatin/prohibitin superfamily)